MNTVTYHNAGRIDYEKSWKWQEELLRANVDLKLQAPRDAHPEEVSTTHHLIFCEHPHVYTLGKSGKAANILIDEAERERLGIQYFPINRGGDITYHGPGQITGYPIFDLEKFRTDIGWYLRQLEEVMIRFLADYGLKGGRIEGATGVWLHTESTYPQKICAFGVRCSRWITMHGFALNVNTDLRYFEYIVPCGIDDKGVTSLQAELGYPLDFEQIKEELKGHFAQVFGYEYQTA